MDFIKFTITIVWIYMICIFILVFYKNIKEDEKNVKLYIQKLNDNNYFKCINCDSKIDYLSYRSCDKCNCIYFCGRLNKYVSPNVQQVIYFIKNGIVISNKNINLICFNYTNSQDNIFYKILSYIPVINKNNIYKNNKIMFLGYHLFFDKIITNTKSKLLKKFEAENIYIKHQKLNNLS